MSDDTPCSQTDRLRQRIREGWLDAIQAAMLLDNLDLFEFDDDDIDRLRALIRSQDGQE